MTPVLQESGGFCRPIPFIAGFDLATSRAAGAENDPLLSGEHRNSTEQRQILAAKKKPNIDRVNRNGSTVMHCVVSYADQKVETIRMLLDAGFDLAPWRSEFSWDRSNQTVLAGEGWETAGVFLLSIACTSQVRFER